MKYFVVFFCVLVLISAALAQERREHRLRRQIRDVASGDECPIICPFLYAPLCAFNQICHRKFDNKCELDASTCSGGVFKEVRLLECDSADVKMCPPDLI